MSRSAFLESLWTTLASPHGPDSGAH